MIHAIPLRQLDPGAGIFLDHWEGRDSVRALLPRYFLDRGAFAEQGRLLATRQYERETLRGVLEKQNQGFGAGARTMENIARLTDPRSVAVLGGQQAGLFGGPLYTVHKALTVLLLARRLEGELGCPVVPIFWIASEDHDLAEINHAFVTDREYLLRELQLSGNEDAKLPVSLVKLGSGIASVLEDAARMLPETGFSSGVLDQLRAAYAPDRTYPQAFGSWMSSILGDKGLALVDPSDPRLKRLAIPLLEREAIEKSPVSRAVAEQTLRLSRVGYPAQIELRQDMLTFFCHDPSRDAIAVDGNGFRIRGSGKRFSSSEMVQRIRDNPESFSPNAALRPLYQDFLFPTIAVVLGPSELAYFSQLPLAYEGMGIQMPVLFPRVSLTLVESRMQKLLEKLGLSLQDVLGRGEKLIDDLLRREIPQSLNERLSDGRRTVREIWEGLVKEIDKLDPTLRQTAELASGTSLKQFEFMEKKIAQAARRKDETLRGQVEKLVASLAPRGALQERTLTALPFLARHGKGVFDQVSDAIDLFAPEHRGVVIGP